MFGKKRRGTSAVDYAPYVVDLNAPLALNDLKTCFAKPFIEALAPRGVPGWDDVECHVITDGGDRVEVLGKDDVPVSSTIDFWAPEVSDEFEAACVHVLESLGAPKGSQLIAPNAEPQRYTPFGVNEGMAVYVDKKCSVDAVLKQLPNFLRNSGKLISHWAGPKETAFYCYGPSYQAMADAIAPFVAEYPLLQGCRIVQIA